MKKLTLMQTRLCQAKIFHGLARDDKPSSLHVREDCVARAFPERRPWQKSTWNSGMQKTTSRESAEGEVRKSRARVTEAWKQISKQK